MKVAFVGDIHGEWRRLDKIFENYPDMPIVQVGDLGLGLPPVINLATGEPFPADPKNFPERFHFIRGNHDNPAVCRTYPNYLGDYGVGLGGIFYLSGAWSIDRAIRQDGVDWWEDEELPMVDLIAATSEYVAAQPSIVVTHTCPKSLALLLTSSYVGSRTESALEMMFEEHQPRLWIFGHWHEDREVRVGNLTFVCLAPGAVRVFDV